MVLHFRPEFIWAVVMLRMLDAFMLRLLWMISINTGVFLYNGGSLIMLLISICPVTIFKTCRHLMWYCRLREMLQFALIGFHLILHSWGILMPAKIMVKLARQQVLRFFYSILMLHDAATGSHLAKKSREQFVFVGNPAFGDRGQGIRRNLRSSNKSFDATLGFPGEGWSFLSMATWNTRSLTFERFQYCKNLGYDVLAITELWRNQSRFQTKSTRFIISTPKIQTKGPDKGKIRFPKDKAAGVGILLSPRAQQKLLSFGSEGERVCWVRLKGPVCNLFTIAVYLPHRGRVQPNQDDTLRDLEAVLSREVAPGDCVCIMGDLNEQLEGGVKSRTGKWVAGEKSSKADKIMQLLQLHELTAINTTFQPKRKSALYTYLQTKCKDKDANDYGEYVGADVRTKYKNDWYEGRVVSTTGHNNTQKWVVKFADNYVRHYDRKSLEKILVRTRSKKVGKQFDYILVSTRWKSCVVNCSTKCQPSIHRDRHGRKTITLWYSANGSGAYASRSRN